MVAVARGGAALTVRRAARRRRHGRRRAVVAATTAARRALPAVARPPRTCGRDPRWLVVRRAASRWPSCLAPRLLAPRAGRGVAAAAVRAARSCCGSRSPPGRGGTGAWDRVFDPSGSFEARERVPARAARARLRPAASSSTASPSWCPSFPVHVAGPPARAAARRCTRSALDHAGAARGAVHRGRARSSAPLAYGARRASCSTSAGRAHRRAADGRSPPRALMFGVTSADALYLTLGLLAAWPLASPRRRAAARGARCSRSASLFAWSLLAVGAWAAILALAARRAARPRSRLGAVCGASCAVHGAFAALTGFDPIGTLARHGAGLPLRESPSSARTGSGCSGSPSASCSCSACRSPGSRCARSRAATPRWRSSPCSAIAAVLGSPRPRRSGSGCPSRRSSASPRRAALPRRRPAARRARAARRRTRSPSRAAVEHRLVSRERRQHGARGRLERTRWRARRGREPELPHRGVASSSAVNGRGAASPTRTRLPTAVTETTSTSRWLRADPGSRACYRAASVISHG